MLLYEDKKEEVGVYEFIPKNNYDLFKYKTDELRKVNADEEIYYAESKIECYSSPVFSESMFKLKNGLYNSSEVDCSDESLEVRKKYGNPYYNKLLISKKNHGNMALLNNYIHGLYSLNDVAKIIYPGSEKYFLFTEKYNVVDSDMYADIKTYIMRNIIQLPESLYKLQLLENGNFNGLSIEDISEQLDLFELRELDSIDKETIRKMDLYGVSDQLYYKTMNKVEKDSKKLQLIKK